LVHRLVPGTLSLHQNSNVSYDQPKNTDIKRPFFEVEEYYNVRIEGQSLIGNVFGGLENEVRSPSKSTLFSFNRKRQRTPDVAIHKKLKSSLQSLPVVEEGT